MIDNWLTNVVIHDSGIPSESFLFQNSIFKTETMRSETGMSKLTKTETAIGSLYCISWSVRGKSCTNYFEVDDVGDDFSYQSSSLPKSSAWESSNRPSRRQGSEHRDPRIIPSRCRVVVYSIHRPNDTHIDI